MKLTTVSTAPRLLSKHYKLNEQYVLTAEGLTPVLIESIEDVYVSRSAGKLEPQMIKNDSAESGESEGEKKLAPGTSVKLKDLISASGGGGVATVAMKMYRLSNTTPKAEISTFLRNNNCTPSAADSVTEAVLKCTKSSIGKAFFLGTAGGAVIYIVLELVKPEWPLKKKLLVCLIGAALLGVIYLVLARLGVMT